MSQCEIRGCWMTIVHGMTVTVRGKKQYNYWRSAPSDIERLMSDLVAMEGFQKKTINPTQIEQKYCKVLTKRKNK